MSKRKRAGVISEREFNEWIAQRLAAFRKQAERLAAAQRSELVGKRVRVNSYKVRAYSVQSHWRIVPTKKES